jgi:hypothetical protein
MQESRPIAPSGEAPPRGTTPSPAQGLLIALALVLSGATLLALHGHVLRYPFLEDDYIFLTEARRGLMGSLEHAIRSVGIYFRPVSRELYFWALHRIVGFEPLAFHRVNFAILLSTVLLVALVGRRLGGMRAGLLAAAVYTLHYPHRVLLGYVCCSQDLLATAFACAAALAQVSGRRRLAGGFLLAALFSKESVAPLPFALAAWEFANAPSAGPSRVRAAMRATWPSWLALAAWATTTAWARMALANPEVRAAAFANAHLTLTPAGLLLGVRLTALALVGLEQPWSVLRDTLPAFQRPGVAGVLGLVGAASLAIPGLLAARSVPEPAGAPRREGMGLAAFGWAWLLVLAVPPILLGTRFNAYYVALPAVGFAWCAGAALARFPGPIVVLVCAALGASSLLANATPVFRSDTDNLKVLPGISVTSAWRLELESVYVRRFRAYLEAHPPARGAELYLEQPFGFTIMGTSANRAPRLWLGDPTFEVRIVTGAPRDFDDRPKQFARFDDRAWNFVPLPDSLLFAIREAIDAYDASRLPEARAAFERALTFARPGVYDSERGVTLANLGAVCVAQGDTAAARAAWIPAIELPTGRRPAILGLARLDLAAGRDSAAREWLRAAVRSDPGDPGLLLELARAERRCGDPTAAQSLWRRVIGLSPSFADSGARAGAAP